MSSRIVNARVLPWLMPLVSTVVSFGIHVILPGADLSLIFLAGVLLCSMFTAMKPGLVCAVLSFATFNFFFVEPGFHFSLIHGRQLLTLVLLLMVAIVTGHLAARLHDKLRALEIGNRWNHQQIALARDLALCVEQERVIEVLIGHLWSCFRLKARLRVEDATPTHASYPQYGDTDGSTLVIESNRAQILFIHERHISACIDVAIKHSDCNHLRHYLEGFTQLAGLAWRRTQAEQELRQELALKQREQIRGDLLASISKDLKLPLSVLEQSVVAIRAEEKALSDDGREHLKQARYEVARLNRYLQNLYDLIQLGQQASGLERSLTDSGQIIESAVERVSRYSRLRSINVEFGGDLEQVDIHPELVEQAVFNLVENAVQYSPAGGTVSVQVSSDDGWLQIDVADKGPGIPRDCWQAIFDMFNHGARHKLTETGTGLGLAVAQGVAEAHGGFCKVLESSSTGTVMRLALPQTQASAA